jgi:hypothetical protein
MENASTYKAVQAVAPGRHELVRMPVRDPVRTAVPPVFATSLSLIDELNA